MDHTLNDQPFPRSPVSPEVYVRFPLIATTHSPEQTERERLTSGNLCGSDGGGDPKDTEGRYIGIRHKLDGEPFLSVQLV